MRTDLKYKEEHYDCRRLRIARTRLKLSGRRILIKKTPGQSAFLFEKTPGKCPVVAINLKKHPEKCLGVPF